MSDTEQIVECVPNFSEGVDEGKLVQIINAMRVEGVSLLDWSMDADHNRSVVTVAGAPDAVREAAIRAVGKAAELIDLTKQTGVHPRIGAADVVPFVPISGVTLEKCALLARQAGLEIWKRYGVPVYFYEAAAARPDRAMLEDVRRGQFEGLRDAVRKDVTRRPDVGGPDLHPTAGASCIGARKFLVAYNIYLDSGDVSIARGIARDIRASNGGLYGVKAMGVLANGRAQVSMNITDFRTTSVGSVYEAVKRWAARFDVKPIACELIGLIPQDAYEPESEWARLIHEGVHEGGIPAEGGSQAGAAVAGFDPERKVFESVLRNPREWPPVV